MGLLDFAGKVAGDVIHGAEDSVKGVFKGAKDIAAGGGKLVLGGLTGNGQEALAGLKGVGEGGLDALSGAANLAELATPEGLATNVLLAGAKEGIQSLSGDPTGQNCSTA